MNSIKVKENWIVWGVGIGLLVIMFFYGLFCWHCVQTVREQTTNIKSVPINRVERVITQSIDADGSVIAQSIKKVIRIRYSLAHSD